MTIIRKVRGAIVNTICAFIPVKSARRKARAILNSDIIEYLFFIHRDMGARIKRVKFTTGFRGRNLILAINDRYIYKFPLRWRRGEIALREKRITDALRDASPVHIPPVTILEYKDKLVRKYDFIHGPQLNQLPYETVLKNKDKLAQQIARFIFDIGRANPRALRDLKPDPKSAPGYMYGWCQGDIYDNFMINPDTMEIIAFIDWEDSEFGDFSRFMTYARFPNEQLLVPLVRAEYDRLYNKNQG